MEITSENAAWATTLIAAAVERTYGGVMVDAAVHRESALCSFKVAGHPPLLLHWAIINRLGRADTVASYVAASMRLPLDE